MPAERAGKEKQTAKLARSPGTLQNTDSVQGKAISHKGEAPKDEGLADGLLWVKHEAFWKGINYDTCE